MHYLVRLIIEGDDIDTVMDQARCVMDNLVEQHEFDWYRTEDDDCAWADCWKPVPLDSDTGKTWVKDAIAAQFDEFKHSMQAIRYMVLNYSDEQIFDEDFGDKPEMHLSRYYFSKASGHHANAALLYDTYGTAIPNNADLRRCIDEAMKYWVIQVDCHNQAISPGQDAKLPTTTTIQSSDRPNHATSPAGCYIIRIALAIRCIQPAPYLPLQLKLQAQERSWHKKQQYTERTTICHQAHQPVHILSENVHACRTWQQMKHNLIPG